MQGKISEFDRMLKPEELDRWETNTQVHHLYDKAHDLMNKYTALAMSRNINAMEPILAAASFGKIMHYYITYYIHGERVELCRRMIAQFIRAIEAAIKRLEDMTSTGQRPARVRFVSGTAEVFEGTES